MCACVHVAAAAELARRVPRAVVHVIQCQLSNRRVCAAEKNFQFSHTAHAPSTSRGKGVGGFGGFVSLNEVHKRFEKRKINSAS